MGHLDPLAQHAPRQETKKLFKYAENEVTPDISGRNLQTLRTSPRQKGNTSQAEDEEGAERVLAGISSEADYIISRRNGGEV